MSLPARLRARLRSCRFWSSCCCSAWRDLSAGGFETIGLDSLWPLLLVQILLLSGSLIICVAAGPGIDPNAAIVTVAGMLAVSAIAVQNALGQVSLHAVPASAFITTNIARFTICGARFGLRALALSAGLALLALAMAAKSNAAEAQVAALSVPDQIDRNRFGSVG
jgi:hypothetical protein